MTRLTAAIAAVLILLTAAVQPTPAAADDATAAIRSVIDGQIAAFQADDGAAAYSYAAPSIRQIFTSPETFMSMVRSGYQPVYRPKSITDGRLREAGGHFVQEVFVVGPDGEFYTALYALQQQPDGEWKISGCRIALTVGESA
ncbi:MAG TPA: DUF4864 domain-containing protein [Methylomirabilota bacterium]|nr:DUF4864 domain-containing protein [Methylomirabilota bacterium]